MAEAPDVVYTRRLDVTVRLHEGDGLLIETLIGRYVLDRDAREIWRRIDGRSSVAAIADALAAATGLAPAAAMAAVQELCERLRDLGLLEPVGHAAALAAESASP